MIKCLSLPNVEIQEKVLSQIPSIASKLKNPQIILTKIITLITQADLCEAAWMRQCAHPLSHLAVREKVVCCGLMALTKLASCHADRSYCFSTLIPALKMVSNFHSHPRMLASQPHTGARCVFRCLADSGEVQVS